VLATPADSILISGAHTLEDVNPVVTAGLLVGRAGSLGAGEECHGGEEDDGELGHCEFGVL
jgi:hypothetical protein